LLRLFLGRHLERPKRRLQMMKRLMGVVAACVIAASPVVLAQTTVHTESKTKQTGPGPDTKVKSESVVGTVKEYEAGKKIKITGPGDKDYSFDLDEAVKVEGNVAVGQMAKVEWTKVNGQEKVTVIAPYALGLRSSTVKSPKTMPAAGHDMHMKSETTTHQPGPNVKTKTEVVVGRVKEYEAGKKIKVTGPNDKDYAFDLDEAVTMNGTVAVGQRVKVEYTKGDMGNHVTVVSLVKK
jgi:hypothetical protein